MNLLNVRRATAPGASARRRRMQSGPEIVEFALVAVLLVPMLIGAFVVGMNLIRSIQSNQVCRNFDNMYIHGGDFSTYPLQQSLRQPLRLLLQSENRSFLCRQPAIQYRKHGQWIGNGHAGDVDPRDYVRQLHRRGSRQLRQSKQLRLHAADSIWQWHAGQLEHRDFGAVPRRRHEQLRNCVELRHRLARRNRRQRSNQPASPMASGQRDNHSAHRRASSPRCGNVFSIAGLEHRKPVGQRRLRAQFLLARYFS
jgi:hypothetical protein